MKKRIICVMLSLVMVLSLTACGGEDTKDDVEVTEASEDEEEASDEADEGDIATADEETVEETSAEDALVLNAPVTIYDENDVTITVNPVENKKFDVTVVNNSAATINWKYDCIALNGYQINDAKATSVDAGVTKDTIISLDDFFGALGSEDVISVEIQSKLYDYASNTETADLGYIFIQGPAYGNEAADLVTDDAMLVFKNDQISAYIDPVFTTTEVDFTMRGFTVNNSDAPVWCSAENFSFNGTPYSGLGDFETAAGHRKFDRIIANFYYSWVGVASADEISTIEFDYTVGDTMVHVTLANNNGTLSVVSAE